ncbi:MAG: hypothetical protein OER21_00155 [Gemmatimonadota bacterium]|nr:hypothetical protein [Gemmatimonadota bacterium]
MRIPCGRHAARALVSAALLGAACGTGEGTGPGIPSPTVYETTHFVIVDEAGTPAAVIDSLGVRLEAEYLRVAAALPTQPAPGRITFRVLAGRGIPFVTPGSRLIAQWAEDLAPEYVVHQLTHLFTRYRRSPFFEEGLAVYLTELLLPDDRTVNPYRGQPPHAWVSLFQRETTLVSLFTAVRAGDFSFSYSGSASDAFAWQVFVQAGSFTRWVIDTYGWTTWWTLYDVEDLGAALGGTTLDLQRAWLAAASQAYPDPLPCATALATRGPLGARETFWCASAEGTSAR